MEMFLSWLRKDKGNFLAELYVFALEGCLLIIINYLFIYWSINKTNF